MKFQRRLHPIRSALAMALLVLPQTAPTWAGEKATISVPRKPTSVNPAATRPAEPFRPMDPGTVGGGSTDPGTPPIPVAPNGPDARTQKEMMERLDRQRNWLLEDPERFGKSDAASRGLPSLEEQDYTTNPRRPQTALGRRLKADDRNSRSATDSGNDRFEDPSNRRDPDSDDPLSADAAAGSRTRYGLTPSWTTPAAAQGPLLELNSALSDSSPSLGDRTSGFGRPGRGLASGLDPYSRERLDRYDRVFSGDDGMERSSSLGDSTERLRQRELRTEILTPAMRNPAAAPPSSALAGEDPDSTAGPLTRSGLANPVTGVTAANTPYLSPLKASEPYESPAAKMLKAPPVQPPRFRP